MAQVKRDILASYKSDTKTTIKNAISLKKIASIHMSPDPPEGGVTSEFAMLVQKAGEGDTEYLFRAESVELARHWVEVLNSIRESHIQLDADSLSENVEDIE